MGPGDTDTATAAARLRLIADEFTAPTRSVSSTTARPQARADSPAPLDLGVLDYMQAAVAEVVTHTRAAAPEAGPAPAEAHAVYAWMREHTAHLEDERQRAGEAIVLRQALEHALAMGDEKAVRSLPCPGCGCWGLFWRPATRKVVCVNRYCTDSAGAGRSFTLAHLAQQQIESRATTEARRAT